MGGSFTHTFEETGEYQIKVTARHEDTNQTDTNHHTVEVREEVQLGVDLSTRPPSPVQVGEQVEFNAIVYGADGRSIQYDWKIDGETRDLPGDRTVGYTFEDEGTFTISVIAKANTEEVSDTIQVQVNDAGPLLSTIEEDGESGTNLATKLEGNLSGRTIRNLEIDIEGEMSNKDALLAIRRLPEVENGEIEIKLRVEEDE